VALLHAAKAMTLDDFEPLSRAERLLLDAYASGGIARVGYRRPPAPSADVTVRAEFLAFMARGGDNRSAAQGRRIEVLGAWVVGRFSVQGASVPTSLWLFRCVFDHAPVFDGARMAGSLGFPDCAMPGLRAQGCIVAGSLTLNSGCSVLGEVRLARSAILRDLNCERAHLGGGLDAPDAGQRPLVADGLRVGGDVLICKGFEAAGEVRFFGARIEGDLRASGARLHGGVDADGARHVALNLDRVHVAGSVLLDNGFSAAGTVRLERARIGGDLDGTSAAFDVVGDATWSDGAALLMDGARVHGVLRLQRLQTALLGASVVDARVGTLADDASTWGQRHRLDGFRYKRLAEGAPTDANFRRGWLTRQRPSHLDADFRPDPWRQVIKVLRRMGHGGDADALAVGRENWLRRIGRIGADAPRGLRWLPRLGHCLFGWVAGYGHRPLRLLMAMVGVWLLCAGVYQFSATQGLMAPVNPLLFSLERLLPLLDLWQRQALVGAPSGLAGLADAAEVVKGGSDWGAVVQGVVVLEAALGWAACLTLIATIAGWADRDRRF
jgi:hypothetical protein